MFTTHGDHIPGTRMGTNPPLHPAQCGGVTSCPDCMLEATAVRPLVYSCEEHSKDTMIRVFDSLREAGVDAELAQKALAALQAKNILFRERKN